jgi:hypothetical protein
MTIADTKVRTAPDRDAYPVADSTGSDSLSICRTPFRVQTLVVILSVATIVALVGQMLWDHFRQRVDLLSARNVFYLGLINFQLFPISVALSVDSYMRKLAPGDPATAGMIFIAITWLFLLIFNIVYKAGWLAESLSSMVKTRFPVPAPGALLTIAVVFFILGAVNRVFLMHVPIINSLAAIFSIGFLCAASGCAIWAWLPRFWNPVYALPAIVIIILSMLLAMHLSFGRRDLLSIILACVWCAYWGYLRQRGNTTLFIRLGSISAVGIVFLAVLSATRGEGGELRSVGQIMGQFSPQEIRAGIEHMAKVQDSGPVSLWVIDTRPDSYPYDTLHSLWYTITQPIPRVIFENKPNALGMDIVTQAGVRNLARGFSYGPGLAGHIANDNPYLALPIYAVFFGIGFAFLDRTCRKHMMNPFVVVCLGTGLGEMMAIPRGELGLFVFRFVLMFLTAWAGMWFIVKLLIAAGMTLTDPTLAQSEEEWSDEDELPENDSHSAPEDFRSLAPYRTAYNHERGG